jgi:hypothetical protein
MILKPLPSLGKHVAQARDHQSLSDFILDGGDGLGAEIRAVDKWAYMTQREPIRAILSAGFSEGSPETAARAQELIGFLSTIGETSYLDLVPSRAD